MSREKITYLHMPASKKVLLMIMKKFTKVCTGKGSELRPGMFEEVMWSSEYKEVY